MATTPIQMREGGTHTIQYALKDAAGAALNLTGATLTWRCGPSGGTYLLELTPTVTDAAAGACEVELSAANVTTLAGELNEGSVRLEAHLKIEDSGGAVDVTVADVEIIWSLFG